MIDVLLTQIGLYQSQVEDGRMSAEILSAIQRAADFLVTTQRSNGSWCDFDTLAGESTEWVTAYVALSMADPAFSPEEGAVKRAIKWLLSRPFYRTGWGYNRHVPVDADSTAWVLRLLQAKGREGHWKARMAKWFLSSCQTTDGGIRTYGSDFRIRIYTRLNRKVSMKGWCNAHVCVTANAAAVNGPHRAKAISFIMENQNLDGSWSPYWWRDKSYLVSLALDCLEKGTVERANAVEWCCEQIREPNECKKLGTFYVASLCDVLLREGNLFLGYARPLIHWILSEQLSDGSWEASAAMRIPPTYLTNPDNFDNWTVGGKGGGSIVLDQHRNYTTATVIRCLSHFKNVLA